MAFTSSISARCLCGRAVRGFNADAGANCTGCGTGDFIPGQYWKNNIDLGMTTLGEDTDAAVTRSDCHAWGASPNIEFYRTVLGIDSDAFGFTKVKITPHLGELTSLKGSMPHPKGNISASYKLENGKWKIQIDTPVTGNLAWKGKTLSLKVGVNEFNL